MKVALKMCGWGWVKANQWQGMNMMKIYLLASLGCEEKGTRVLSFEITWNGINALRYHWDFHQQGYNNYPNRLAIFGAIYQFSDTLREQWLAYYKHYCWVLWRRVLKCFELRSLRGRTSKKLEILKDRMWYSLIYIYIYKQKERDKMGKITSQSQGTYLPMRMGFQHQQIYIYMSNSEYRDRNLYTPLWSTQSGKDNDVSVYAIFNHAVEFRSCQEGFAMCCWSDPFMCWSPYKPSVASGFWVDHAVDQPLLILGSYPWESQGVAIGHKFI